MYTIEIGNFLHNNGSGNQIQTLWGGNLIGETICDGITLYQSTRFLFEHGHRKNFFIEEAD